MSRVRTTEELGQAVREERRLQGLVQEDLALAAGTGRRFIIELERGKPSIQLGPVLDVLNALGLDLEIGKENPAETEHRGTA